MPTTSNEVAIPPCGEAEAYFSPPYRGDFRLNRKNGTGWRGEQMLDENLRADRGLARFQLILDGFERCRFEPRAEGRRAENLDARIAKTERGFRLCNLPPHRGFLSEPNLPHGVNPH